MELFRDTLRCGTIRKAGNDGWYFEVNRLRDISELVVPFFTRFPLVGQKAMDFALFAKAVALMSSGLDETKYVSVLELRDRLNSGGKRRYTMERILRGHTPDVAIAPAVGSDEMVRSHGRP